VCRRSDGKAVNNVFEDGKNWSPHWRIWPDVLLNGGAWRFALAERAVSLSLSNDKRGSDYFAWQEESYGREVQLCQSQGKDGQGSILHVISKLEGTPLAVLGCMALI
jgi:hypothetical protein